MYGRLLTSNIARYEDSKERLMIHNLWQQVQPWFIYFFGGHLSSQKSRNNTNVAYVHGVSNNSYK